MSDELRIGEKDRAVVLVLGAKYGEFPRKATTQAIGVEGPFPKDVQAAIGTIYDWLAGAKAKKT